MNIFALVSPGCRNEIPYTGSLKQQECISYGSGGWDIQDKGVGQVGFLVRAPSDIGSGLLTMLLWREGDEEGREAERESFQVFLLMSPASS